MKREIEENKKIEVERIKNLKEFMGSSDQHFESMIDASNKLL